MRLSGQAEEADAEQKLLNVPVTEDWECVVVSPGPYAEVKEMRDEVQEVRLESLLRAHRKVLHVSLIPEGIRGLWGSVVFVF